MRQNIRTCRALFCVVSLMSFYPYLMHGETATVNGITWTYVSFGNGVKIGNGKSDNNAVPASTSGAIEIPSSLGGKPVIGVNEWAFRGCEGITSVTMPDTLTNIGKHAFDSCSSLKSIKFGNGVGSIEQWAFLDCSCLEQVIIPASVTRIVENAFANCCKIQDVVFPGAFSLSKIFRDGYASITKAVMVGSLTSIGDLTFAGCSSLEYLSIPNSVTSISKLALKDCPNLKEIFLPYSFQSKINDLSIATECVVRFRPTNGKYEEYIESTEWPVVSKGGEVVINDWFGEKCLELACAPADYETAEKFMELAKSVGEGCARQVLLQAAALAMLYARKMDNYAKEVKPIMANAERFEESLRTECPVCEGDGKEYEDCQSCHKTGRCPGPGCSGGYVQIRKRTFGYNLQPSVSYSDGSRKCSSCNGTGKCHYCDGKGKIAKPCRKCAGKGWIVTPSKVLGIYLQTIADLPIVLHNPNLEYIDGKWMTPGSFRKFPFEVFQILSPGQALCRDKAGNIFCLLYSAQDNRNIAEGEHYANDLYRCGTYSYITVQDAPRTVRQFSIDFETADRENRRQGIFK